MRSKMYTRLEEIKDIAMVAKKTMYTKLEEIDVQINRPKVHDWKSNPNIRLGWKLLFVGKDGRRISWLFKKGNVFFNEYVFIEDIKEQLLKNLCSMDYSFGSTVIARDERSGEEFKSKESLVKFIGNYSEEDEEDKLALPGIHIFKRTANANWVTKREEKKYMIFPIIYNVEDVVLDTGSIIVVWKGIMVA